MAPIALVGGWTWGARVQPAAYDPVRDTISALAAHGATQRWIMTTGLAVLGLCHLLTAAGLTEAGRPARGLLAVGGLATVGVAVFAQPSAGHVPAATVGFVALALWPAAPRLPWRRSARAGAAIMLGLLGWLEVQLQGGGLVGVSERLAAGAEAVFPLIVVVALVLHARGHRAVR